MQVPNRLANGNILTIAAIIGFVFLVISIWAIDVFWLHFLSKKEMSAAEKVAMAAAVALNKDDNIGQMNNILSASREHICSIRFFEYQASENPQVKSEDLKLLCRDLAQNAHDCITQLAKARGKLEALRIEEAIEAAEKSLTSAGSPNAAHMAGIATSGLSINFEQSSLGCAKRTASETDSAENLSPSNVVPVKYCFSESFDKALLDYDKKFIDESANLYKGNLQSPLDLNYPGGGDDSDLQFLLSSLPPYLNYTAPPRLIQPNEFHRMAPLKSGALPKYIPTAVYIVLQLDVKDTQSGASNRLMAPGVAVTNGAGPPPEVYGDEKH